jgi:hypothetical protein
MVFSSVPVICRFYRFLPVSRLPGIFKFLKISLIFACFWPLQAPLPDGISGRGGVLGVALSFRLPGCPGLLPPALRFLKSWQLFSFVDPRLLAALMVFLKGAVLPDFFISLVFDLEKFG